MAKWQMHGNYNKHATMDLIYLGFPVLWQCDLQVSVRAIIAGYSNHKRFYPILKMNNRILLNWNQPLMAIGVDRKSMVGRTKLHSQYQFPRRNSISGVTKCNESWACKIQTMIHVRGYIIYKYIMTTEGVHFIHIIYMQQVLQPVVL